MSHHDAPREALRRRYHQNAPLPCVGQDLDEILLHTRDVPRAIQLQHQGAEGATLAPGGNELLNDRIVETGHETEGEETGIHFGVNAEGTTGRGEGEVLVLVDGDADLGEGIEIGRIKGQESVRIDLCGAARPNEPIMEKDRDIVSVPMSTTKPSKCK